MRALILAGGAGNRLKPFTNTREKMLMPILNVPYIERLLCNLYDAGLKEVYLSVGRTFDLSTAREWKDTALIDKDDMRIIFRKEDYPLGTGGAILNAVDHQYDDWFIMNGDIYTDISIPLMLRRYEELGNGAVLMAVTRVKDSSTYGTVRVAGIEVTKFQEKTGIFEPGIVNVGMYILTPSKHIYDTIKKQHKVGNVISLERDVFPYVGINVVEDENKYWTDFGTCEKYLELNMDLLDIGDDDNAIAPSASCSSLSGISHSCIGQNTHVKVGATIMNSVILENVIVGGSARINNCVIGENVSVGNNVRLQDAFIGANSIVK